MLPTFLHQATDDVASGAAVVAFVRIALRLQPLAAKQIEGELEAVLRAAYAVLVTASGEVLTQTGMKTKSRGVTDEDAPHSWQCFELQGQDRLDRLLERFAHDGAHEADGVFVEAIPERLFAVGRVVQEQSDFDGNLAQRVKAGEDTGDQRLDQDFRLEFKVGALALHEPMLSCQAIEFTRRIEQVGGVAATRPD